MYTSLPALSARQTLTKDHKKKNTITGCLKGPGKMKDPAFCTEQQHWAHVRCEGGKGFGLLEELKEVRVAGV